MSRLQRRLGPRIGTVLGCSLLGSCSLWIAACASQQPGRTDGGAVANPAGGGGTLNIWQPEGGPPVPRIPADVGSYGLGASFDSGGPAVAGGVTGVAANGCTSKVGLILVGLVRDFKGAEEAGGHPDFEVFTGSKETVGLVAPALGADKKPSYASKCEGTAMRYEDCPFGGQTTSKERFDEWYRNVPGVNQAHLIYFELLRRDGLASFGSDRFFPLDGAGWGNSGVHTDGKEHNYGFTTELHTSFKYKGGESFSFKGDDDLWVFINGRLAVDLGGSHSPATAKIDLDSSATELGLEPDGTYPLDLFHAERHTTGSQFIVDTNFTFVDCGTISP